jgi:hypothetical protein|tara:strand:+ start:361 stop:534 length:174 start_codon:yes stop_codon:yes gene_type:complete
MRQNCFQRERSKRTRGHERKKIRSAGGVLERDTTVYETFKLLFRVFEGFKYLLVESH